MGRYVRYKRKSRSGEDTNVCMYVCMHDKRVYVYVQYVQRESIGRKKQQCWREPVRKAKSM